MKAAELSTPPSTPPPRPRPPGVYYPSVDGPLCSTLPPGLAFLPSSCSMICDQFQTRSLLLEAQRDSGHHSRFPVSPLKVAQTMWQIFMQPLPSGSLPLLPSPFLPSPILAPSWCSQSPVTSAHFSFLSFLIAPVAPTASRPQLLPSGMVRQEGRWARLSFPSRAAAKEIHHQSCYSIIPTHFSKKD